MGNIIKLGATLLIFCVVAALSLAYVNDLTSPVIEKNAMKIEKTAKTSLFIGDTLDLTLFPDGTYEVLVEGSRVLVIPFKNNTLDDILVSKKYFNISSKEQIKKITKEIRDKLNIEQFIDLKKVPEKHKKLYSAIKTAFSSKISFQKKTVVMNCLGNNLLLNKENNTSEFRDSIIKFKKNDDNTVQIEKVDSDYYESIGENILFNDNSDLPKDNDNVYSLFEYDKAFIGDKFLGYVIKVAPTGYSSNLNTLAGISPEGKIIGIQVVSQQETPGLGAKCQEAWFQDQFKGLSKDQLYLKMKNKKGEVDAITAATITSNALTEGLRQGLESFMSIIK